MQSTSQVSRIPDQITLVDQNDPNNVYLGNAKRGSAQSSAVWQIRKIVNNSNVISILFASGSRAYNAIWNNRASLSYS